VVIFKAISSHRVTTVCVKQAICALDPTVEVKYDPADLKIEPIGDLLDHERSALLS
jgi:hypothetical protein